MRRNEFALGMIIGNTLVLALVACSASDPGEHSSGVESPLVADAAAVDLGDAGASGDAGSPSQDTGPVADAADAADGGLCSLGYGEELELAYPSDLATAEALFQYGSGVDLAGNPASWGYQPNIASDTAANGLTSDDERVILDGPAAVTFTNSPGPDSPVNSSSLPGDLSYFLDNPYPRSAQPPPACGYSALSERGRDYLASPPGPSFPSDLDFDSSLPDLDCVFNPSECPSSPEEAPMPHPEAAQWSTNAANIRGAPAAGSAIDGILGDATSGIDLDGIANGVYSCNPNPPTPRWRANTAAGDYWAYLYLPGIQAFDNVPGLDDQGTANRYNDAAQSGAGARAAAQASYWRVYHYHNVPSWTGYRYVHDNANPPNVFGYVQSIAKGNNSTSYEGDKNEVRLLSAWVSAANQARFIAATPGAGTTRPAGPNAWPPPANARAMRRAVAAGWTPTPTAREFGAYAAGQAADPSFIRFMRETAWYAALSYYCRKPVFAHSGAGPVLMFVARLLDAWSESLPGRPLRGIAARYAGGQRFNLYGLEEVVSQQVVNIVQPLPSWGGKMVIYNYIENSGNQGGSNTWRNTIAAEITRVGQAPFSMNFDMGLAWATRGGFGHGYIGWYPLRYGYLSNPPPSPFTF